MDVIKISIRGDCGQINGGVPALNSKAVVILAKTCLFAVTRDAVSRHPRSWNSLRALSPKVPIVSTVKGRLHLFQK
jgi:hypothetical protein